MEYIQYVYIALFIAGLAFFVIFSQVFFRILASAALWSLVGVVICGALGTESPEPILVFAAAGAVLSVVKMLAKKDGSVVTTFIIQALSAPFYVLNQLQHRLHRIWRGLAKDPGTGFCKVFRNSFLVRIPFVLIDGFNYIILTPVRFVNAVYYDLILHPLLMWYDCFMELLYPQEAGMYQRKGWGYFWRWLVWLPNRLVKYVLFKCLFVLIEGVIFVLIDTVIPAWTMFHGTSPDSGFLISSPGTWLVGDGNYAGSGIYFGIAHRTARHYAKGNVCIVARVAPGRVINLALAEKVVRQSIMVDGDTITEVCLSNGYNTSEWWRVTSDAYWWEYCLLKKRGEYNHNRIRILYVFDYRRNSIRRISGGAAMWLFRVKVWDNMV